MLTLIAKYRFYCNQFFSKLRSSGVFFFFWFSCCDRFSLLLFCFTLCPAFHEKEMGRNHRRKWAIYARNVTSLRLTYISIWWWKFVYIKWFINDTCNMCCFYDYVVVTNALFYMYYKCCWCLGLISSWLPKYYF